MLDFAVALTTAPGSMTRAHVETLRAAGFDDRSISQIVQITALFAYYNRIADGLGIEDEPEWTTPAAPPDPRAAPRSDRRPA
jgi:uncharacterized peroxidase-related enzyme